ncbi:hypothetical protein OF83DRAFT_1072083 [Amylostereum chailletii]|nr:hypothetical protein OF83DRAFT_1072083 [Amylostereum chailletii]
MLSAKPKEKKKRKYLGILGRETLKEVWADQEKTTLLSWSGRAPAKLGSPTHGKLTADQWRTACLVALVVTLVRLWGHLPPDSRKHKILTNYMHLVSSCKIAMMRVMTPERIKQYEEHYHAYLSGMKALYVYSPITPNQHLSFHLPRILADFGPVHAWACFIFERCLRWLKMIPTNAKFGWFNSICFSHRHVCS